jgi:hypothetical protein
MLSVFGPKSFASAEGHEEDSITGGKPIAETSHSPEDEGSSDEKKAGTTEKNEETDEA